MGITAAKVKHVNFDVAGAYTVSWTLPASKTDVQALGATRTHRCICEKGGSAAWGDKRDRLCPYHIMVELIAMVAALWGDADTGELPLFPSTSGHVLSHSATVAAIQHVATCVGEPLHRDVDQTRLDRFGEHCMRVSGAQFLSRALLWDLFVIQLFGRWGSLAVAKYVQDAPLSQASSRPPATSLAMVLTMVQEATLAERGQGDTIGDASLRADIDAIKEKLKASQFTSTEELVDRAHLVKQAEKGFAPPAKLLVANPASDIVHSVLINADEHVPAEACVTYCGWKYALASAPPFPRVPGASSLPIFCRTCRKRETGDDSDASSDQADEDAGSAGADVPLSDDDLIDE